MEERGARYRQFHVSTLFKPPVMNVNGLDEVFYFAYPLVAFTFAVICSKFRGTQALEYFP